MLNIVRNPSFLPKRSAARLFSLALLFWGLVPAFAGFGPTVSQLPRIADSRLDSALARTARGIILNNVDFYTDGLVHRPNSEEPGDAVSEGQAYGMIVALYAGDQANFDRIWDAAEKTMWSEEAKLYNWRVGAKGGLIGTGMATDADQDIALMLLFADSLAKKGVWKAHTSPKSASYKKRALDIINSIWNSAVEEGKYLAPGAGWGGKAFVNPGYFSPASYKIFAQVDPNHDWKGVVDQCYRTLSLSPGVGKGLLPDWMVPDGTYYNGSLGYNAFRSGKAMYKDAIRVHWRLAMDWLWFGDARAKTWLDSATAFIVSPDRANFYTMDGLVLPVTDTFTLGSGEKRSRREYSELTVGMWACAPFVSKGPIESKPWAEALLKFAPETTGLWGKTSDATLPDLDGSTPNEEYFEQFLAWFGCATLAGRFSNIWEDLDDPLPGVALAWSSPLSATPDELDFQKAPLRVSGAFNKPVTWMLQVTHHATGAAWSYSDRGQNISVDWTGFDAAGKRFPQGWCLVRVSARGMTDAVQWVWLAHHRDLRLDATWLLVDDFSGPTLQPNLGSWSTFNNSKGGGNAKVGPLVPSGTGAESHLPWTFDLGTGGYQYCGVEWQSGGWAGLAGADKISFRAKAAQKTVVDFHMMQTNITDDNYFGALDTLTTTWKVFEHKLSDLRGRLGQRDGKADATKANGFHWHVQFDKNPDAATGSVMIDDLKIGGNLTAMYAAPEAALAKTGPPPALGIKSPGRGSKSRARGKKSRKVGSAVVTPEGNAFLVSGRMERVEEP